MEDQSHFKHPVKVNYPVCWDRVARPGLIHIGDFDRPAEFAYFK